MITRTISQLHFEDLEPHRFEDLIRQLIYDFKEWSSLEATGKLGQDDGIDILGRERIKKIEIEDLEDKEEVFELEERIWNIQCKREKSIAPQKIIKIIKESFVAGRPDCYILAAACNFSKKARDVFREEMVNYGIKEFYIWGKTELEDMLFQEKNDYLLFAYFGISIHLKQKNELLDLKKKIALKKKIKDLVLNEDKNFEGVVIVEVDNTEYTEKLEHYFFLGSDLGIRGIEVIFGRFFAYVDEDNKEYDYCEEAMFYKPTNRNLDNQNRYYSDEKKIDIEKEKEGFVEKRFILPYDQIREIDFIGDVYSDYKPIIYIKDKKIIGKEERIIIEIGIGYSKRYYNEKEFKRIKVY